MVVTVDEVNKSFADKGMYISLPLNGNIVVTGIEIMEKVRNPGYVKVLLRVKFLNEQGKETQEIFLCEGSTEITRKPPPKVPEPPKKALLPMRESFTFENDEEVLDYLKSAIIHLLNEKGYVLGQQEGADFYFEKADVKQSEEKGSKPSQGFFVNLCVRLDDLAFERAKSFVELRRSLRSLASNNDYALVVPAIQESLGIPLRFQERWVARNQEYLSVHRIGVYGVDNQDPNRIYPFTIYPMAIELKRYFMITSQQWSMVRSRYVLERAKLQSQDSE